MSKLDEIVARKRRDIREALSAIPVEEMRQLAEEAPFPPAFAASLRAPPMGLIAELKRRSPSAGEIRTPFDPPSIAAGYVSAGARALSVLMDEPYFGGGPQDFSAVRNAVQLPLLYKEFVVDPWQIWHARGLGASAVLLIAGVLSLDELIRFQAVAADARVECLVEVHDAEQMEQAEAAQAACIGVNNRDLKTLQVNLDTSLHLVDEAPPGCTLVSESGIRDPADVEKLHAAGYHAVLVGEHLLRQSDPGTAAGNLMETAWASS